MQKQIPEGIVLCCDFCGSEWDEVKPMIEGHLGSIICLDCLRVALVEHGPNEGQFRCTMCVREPLPATMPRWDSSINAAGHICHECIEQAARAFHKDPDTQWKWDKKLHPIREA